MPPTTEFIQEQLGHETASCGIEIAKHRTDTKVFPCHKTAIVECADCGTDICKDHAIHCATCDQWFCMIVNGFCCHDEHKCSRAVAASVEGIAQVIL